MLKYRGTYLKWTSMRSWMPKLSKTPDTKKGLERICRPRRSGCLCGSLSRALGTGMHLITSQALAVGRLRQVTASLLRAPAVRQYGRTSRSSRRTSAAYLRLFGYRASWYPDPSPPEPQPDSPSCGATARLPTHGSLWAELFIWPESLQPLPPSDTHIQSRWGQSLFFQGWGLTPRGGGLRYQAAGRPGAGMLVKWSWKRGRR